VRHALRKPSKSELAHREWRRRGALSIIGTNITGTLPNATEIATDILG
jgi:hypothetical protein